MTWCCIQLCAGVSGRRTTHTAYGVPFARPMLMVTMMTTTMAMMSCACVRLAQSLQEVHGAQPPRDLHDRAALAGPRLHTPRHRLHVSGRTIITIISIIHIFTIIITSITTTTTIVIIIIIVVVVVPVA
jgi:hypothetical protein